MRLLLALAFAAPASASEPKVPCRDLPDPAAHVRPVLRRLVGGLRERRRVRMTVQLIYSPDLLGPAYGGGETPPLSESPRGTVWIGPQFVDFCRDEDSMALILAHELAHIYLGDAPARLEDWLTWRGRRVASMGDDARRRSRRWRERRRDEIARHESVYGPTPGGEAGYGSFQLENAGVFQEQERRADELAVVIAGQAGFDPRGGLNWYRSFGHVWPGFNLEDPLSTHPSFPDRIAAIEYWADRHFPALAPRLPK